MIGGELTPGWAAGRETELGRIAARLVRRLQRGEDLGVEDLAQGHPELAIAIRRIAATLRGIPAPRRSDPRGRGGPTLGAD